MGDHFWLKKEGKGSSTTTTLAWNSNFLDLIHAAVWMEENAWGITFQEEKKTEQGGYLKNHQLVFMQMTRIMKISNPANRTQKQLLLNRTLEALTT